MSERERERERGRERERESGRERRGKFHMADCILYHLECSLGSYIVWNMSMYGKMSSELVKSVVTR